MFHIIGYFNSLVVIVNGETSARRSSMRTTESGGNFVQSNAIYGECFTIAKCTLYYAKADHSTFFSRSSLLVVSWLLHMPDTMEAGWILVSLGLLAEWILNLILMHVFRMFHKSKPLLQQNLVDLLHSDLATVHALSASQGCLVSVTSEIGIAMEIPETVFLLWTW